METVATIEECRLGHAETLQRAAAILAAAPGSIDLATEYRILAEGYRRLCHLLGEAAAAGGPGRTDGDAATAAGETAAPAVEAPGRMPLPLCMVCHKIHTDDKEWIGVEAFFARHADILFSHGICPDCVKQTYGRLGEQILARQNSLGEAHAPSRPKERAADDSLVQMRSVVERAIRENNPLASEVEKFFKRQAKLVRRFDKIVALSDSYQLQLREFNLRLELMAHTDPLTGVNNRGYFMELLNVELSRAIRHQRVLSVLLLDLDHFKSVNDTHGHAAGDEALRSVTRVIQASGLRKTDFFGRIGGEEFAIVLPETGLKSAAEVAERVRANLENAEIPVPGARLRVTASIGVSQCQAGDTEDSLLQRADHAMYLAKNGGRNRVCLGA